MKPVLLCTEDEQGSRQTRVWGGSVLNAHLTVPRNPGRHRGSTGDAPAIRLRQGKYEEEETFRQLRCMWQKIDTGAVTSIMMEHASQQSFASAECVLRPRILHKEQREHDFAQCSEEGLPLSSRARAGQAGLLS